MLRLRVLLIPLAVLSACSKPAPKAENKPGYIDCDGDPRNGNETNAKADRNNCGVCGNACRLDAECVNGICKQACKGTFRDCDGKEENGCETDVTLAAEHCGSCGTSCGKGGACVKQRCVSQILEKADVQGASAIAVSGGELFFVSESRGIVKKIDLTKETETGIATGERSPWTLVVHGGFVYWAARDPGGAGTAGVVRKAPTKGGPATTVFHSKSHYPQAIAVDATGIYWTEYNLGNVMHVALAGGQPQTIATGQSFPTGIAIADGYVYWTARETEKEPGTGGVFRRALGGGAVTQVVQKRKQPSDLAVAGGTILFLEGTTLHKAPAAGGEATPLTDDMAPKALALDAASGYWLSGASPVIKRTSTK